MSIRYTIAALVIAMIQFGSVVHADDKPTAGGIEVTPVIWHSEFGVYSKAVIYKKSMLVISSKDGVAAIVFDKPITNGVTYRYRFLAKGQNKELVGEGKVFEKYKTTLNLIFVHFVENDGGKTSIQAGAISLTWSFHDRGSGWIYIDNPTQIRVLTADAKSFTKVDLKKFIK